MCVIIFLATKGTPGTTIKSTSPSPVASEPTRPAVTRGTEKPLPNSKATVPTTKGEQENNKVGGHFFHEMCLAVYKWTLVLHLTSY